MDISSLKKDPKTISSGVWIGDIPGMGDLRLHVRGMTSPLYIATFNRLARAAPGDQRDRTGTVTPEASIILAGRAIHETVLLDWDGLTSDGEPVPYSSDLALEWLTDPDYIAGDNTFADAVVFAAKVVDKSLAKTAKVIGKN